MKSGIYNTIMLAVLALVSTSASASTYEDVSPDVRAWAEGGGYVYNMERGGRRIASLPDGKTVMILGYASTRAKVFYNGAVQGWMGPYHFTTTNPFASYDHRFNHSNISNIKDYTAIVTAASGLNVRSAPTTGKILTAISQNKRVRVIRRYGAWGEVYFDGQVRGWSKLEFLRRI